MLNNSELNVVVTGGSGCLGLAIIQCVQRRLPQASIHVLDLSIPNTNGKDIAGVEYHQIDICDAAAVSKLFIQVQPQAVIHTAGLIPSAAKRLGVGDAGLRRVNVSGTQSVLDAARSVGSCAAFVLTSSCDVVKGDSWADLSNVNESMALPQKFDEVYPETKAIAEHMVLSSASSTFKTAAIRTHGIIGPNDNNIIPLIASAPRNISFGPGTNLYDFSSASNVALAHVLAVENLLSLTVEISKSANGKAFFVTDDRPLPMRKIMEMIWECLDYGQVQSETEQPKKLGLVIPVPIAYAIIWTMSSLAELIGREPWISTSELGDSVAVRYFDNSLAKHVLGYVPETKLEDSIQSACKMYKARYRR